MSKCKDAVANSFSLCANQIDLDEAHLPKTLADFGGHYMRPDLIRLLVDTRRKGLITHADTNGDIGSYSTLNRVGLSAPLIEPKPDIRLMKKMVPYSVPLEAGHAKGIAVGVNGAPNGKCVFNSEVSQYPMRKG